MKEVKKEIEDKTKRVQLFNTRLQSLCQEFQVDLRVIPTISIIPIEDIQNHEGVKKEDNIVEA